MKIANLSTYIFLLFFLAGCYADPQKLIDEAKSLPPGSKEAKELLEKASERNWDMRSKADHNKNAVCSQYAYDLAAISMQINSIEYRNKLSIEDEPQALIKLYNQFNDVWVQLFNEFDKQSEVCQRLYSLTLVKKSIYQSSLDEHKKITNELAIKYQRLTNEDFFIAERKIMAANIDHARSQKWDLMNSDEKANMSGNNQAVKDCLDSALANNKSAEEIPNIVSDTAKLCKQGLK